MLMYVTLVFRLVACGFVKDRLVAVSCSHGVGKRISSVGPHQGKRFNRSGLLQARLVGPVCMEAKSEWSCLCTAPRT